jgi:pimeloyl-ACP methyl ester carboxylesterase
MANQHDGRTTSFDGVEIAYSESGSGPVSLVFIHGGLANRTFWAPQMSALGDRFHMAALDLAGHGDSGRNRPTWSIPAFAEDVRAVADALGLQRVILVGNSLGGAVALDAAPLLAGRAIGIIGADTLHAADAAYSAEEAKARGAAYRADFAGECAAMIHALFHPGEHLDLQAWTLKVMLAMDRETVARIMEGFAGYDLEASFRRAGVPLRAINGDLWPTRIEENRKLADFDAVIMTNAGHYPMLERPDEFNRLLAEVADGLSREAER